MNAPISESRLQNLRVGRLTWSRVSLTAGAGLYRQHVVVASTAPSHALRQRASPQRSPNCGTHCLTTVAPPKMGAGDKGCIVRPYVESSLKGSGDPKADLGAPEIWPLGIAEGKIVVDTIVPRAFPEDTQARISSTPFTAVCRSAVIVWVPRVLNPFGDIADHVVNPETVGREASHRCRLLGIPLAAAAMAVCEINPRVIPPWKPSRRSGSTRVLPLGFRQQPVRFSGFAG